MARATARDPAQRPGDAGQFLAEVAVAHDAMTDEELDAGDPDEFPAGTENPPADDTLAGEMLAGSWTAAQAAGPAIVSGLAATDVELELTGGMLADASHETAIVPRPFGGPPRADPPPRPPRRSEPRGDRPEQRKGLIAIGIVLAIALIVSLGAWWLGSGGYSTVPNVIGKSQAEATKMAADAGLKIRYAAERVYSDSVPADRIARTEPAAGERARKGSEFVLYLSRGPQLFRVPKLVGLTREQAEAELTKAHLAVGEVTEEYNGTVAAGQVIATTPVAGSPLARDGVVDLVVSKGPDEVDVPNVMGQSTEDASNALRAAGLNPEVIEEVTDQQQWFGIVFFQDPASGTVPRGTKITIKVGKEAQLVTVPDLIEMQVAQARRELRRLGLVANVTNLGGKNAHVINQVPGAGTQVPEGSEVSIWAL